MSKREGPGRPTEWILRAGAYVHDAPVTFLYIALLGFTTLLLQSVSPRAAHMILRTRSTNLVEIRRDPLHALVSSVFWISGEQNAQEYVFWAVLFAVVVARAEQWLGTLRMIAVFFAAHVAATLFTVAIAAFAIDHGFAPSRLARIIDVGVSYGFAGVAAAYTYRVRRRLRRWYAAALIAGFLGGLVFFGGYGDIGHLVALGVGFAAYPLTRRPKGPRARPSDPILSAAR